MPDELRASGVELRTLGAAEGLLRVTDGLRLIDGLRVMDGLLRCCCLAIGALDRPLEPLDRILDPREEERALDPPDCERGE